MYDGLGKILYIDSQLIYEIIMQLISTFVICFVLAKLVYVPVKEFLEKRAKRVADEISTAEENLREANNLKAQYSSKMADIDKERKEILDSAHKRGLEREEQIVKEAKEEAKAIRARVTLEIEREKDKVKEEMKNQIIDISAIMASKIIEEEVEASKQSKLLDDAIDELGDVKWLS